MVVAHNILAMNANRMHGLNTNVRTKSTEKLSSGYKVNRAADDASGLAISEKMRRQIRGLTQASANCQDGIAFCQVADGALNEVHDMLQRMNELSIQSANGTNSKQDREYLDSEVQNIKSELSRIFDTTEFNNHIIWEVPYVPDVKRNDDPVNYMLYNDTETGRIGGLSIDNVRYTWKELGIAGYIDENSATFKTDGEVDNRLSNGERLTLSFNKGDDLDHISRVYHWAADKDGIIINDYAKIPWADMKLDPSNLKEGKYEFDYAGATIGFKVAEGDTFSALLHGINGDGISEVTWKTIYAQTNEKDALLLKSNGSLSFTRDNQKYLLDTNWIMKADQKGVKLSSDQFASDYTQMAWSSFKDVATGENPIVDWGLKGDETDEVSLSGDATYKYEDKKTGFHFEFVLEDEISKEAAIDSINDAKVLRTFSAQASKSNSKERWEEKKYAKSGDLVVSVGTDKLSFGMQNILGRNMDTKATFTTEAKVASYDSTKQQYTYSYSISGVKTNFSESQTANYQATIKGSDIDSFIQNGGKAQFTLVLQNGSSLLSSATSAEIADGIKGVDSTLSMSIDFNEIATSYREAIAQRTKEYDAYVSANGYNATKEKQFITDKEAILALHRDAVVATLGTTDNPVTSKFESEAAKVNTYFSLNLTKAYETEFDYKVDPPIKRMDIQAGAEAYQIIPIEWKPLSLSILGMGGTNVKTAKAAQTAIETVKSAMQEISIQRSNFGAQQNRMEHTIKNLDNVVENTTDAESAIRDTDMAKEMVRLANLNVLDQVGQSILAQTNQSKQGVLSLL